MNANHIPWNTPGRYLFETTLSNSPLRRSTSQKIFPKRKVKRKKIRKVSSTMEEVNAFTIDVRVLLFSPVVRRLNPEMK